ncbi:MAG: sodium:solute symporter family protein [bacterium]
MLSTIDTSIIIAYMIFMIAIGLYASRKQDSIEDFFIAGGNVGTFSIACLWLASWVGGAAIVGGTSKVYSLGISGGWYIICMAIGCLLFGLFFAVRVKRWGKEKNLLTYPDLIESNYDGRTRIVATITTALAFIGFAAGQLAAAGVILSALLGWDYSLALLAASGIIILYTATGGFLAVTYTDWVQFTLLFVGIVFVGIPVAIANGGTWEALTTQLPDSHYDPIGWGLPTMLALVVSISLSFFVAMDSYTRMFAAKNEQVAYRGTLWAVLFLLPLAVGAVWLGMTAAILYPEVENSQNILTIMVLDIFPVGLKGLMLVGILAALMSTADICILTAAANGSRDIYQRFINPDVTQRKIFQLSIGLSVIVGAAAAFMAWQMQDIVEILLVAFTINSAALFVPTIAIVVLKSPSKEAAFWSITLSLTTVTGWYAASALELAPLFSIDPLWPGLFVSLAVFVLVDFLGSRTPASGLSRSLED